RNPIITKILKNYDNTSSVDGMLPSKIIKERPQPPKPPKPRIIREEGLVNRNFQAKWKHLIRKIKKLFR
ncbi:MAG: hypothetical protein ACW98D_17170, partial [Promethearchaeota archaeon]